MAAYPPGGTFFDGKKSFTDVPVDAAKDNAISTTPFLEAAESLTTLFGGTAFGHQPPLLLASIGYRAHTIILPDVLGSAAFKPVKSDMTGNIKKIKDRQLAAPMESETLQDLVKNELKTKKHTATEGLVWLVRGLDFTAQALRQNISNSDEELSASFRASYGNTLSKHHSFLIKPIFSAAMSATPYRKDFYAKLGEDPARVNKELAAWLDSLEKDVKILNEFLARKESKW
ncbi:hypothetical protein MBLNU459_g5103t2 [Dothideomycetes sp. NU459]